FPVPDSLAGPGRFRFVFGSDDTGTREGWYIDDVDVAGPVGIEGPEPEADDFRMFSAYPNPFTESLTFAVSGIPDGQVAIEIFDLAGRLIASPVMSDPGEVRTLIWGGQDIPAGVYIARVSLEGSEELVQHIVKID
ncbi:MAG: T9SS type A sorting domain-containing protein, partial [Candidatus Fermentibacteraceae bacterium]|nr:T9SS type A sorting domain-containing protein [Candidatus Fermentibacteraceae bacterium]